MRCCNKGKVAYTKSVTLTFKRDELLYDANNLAYIESDVMKTEDEHDRHQVADIGEEGNIDRVTRVMSLAVDTCVEELYPYTKREAEADAVHNDILVEVPLYRILMKLPEDFSQTTVEYLEKLIHEFIVYRVLADWLSITNPSRAEAWTLKAEGIMAKMKETVNSRINGRHKRPYPFG